MDKLVTPNIRLSIISYKFDCIYMAISVLVMFLPVLFAKKKMILYLIVVFLSSLVMCMTYQASAGIFPMFVILVCLNRWFEKEKMSEIMKFAFASAIPYLAGILFFRKCLMVWRVDYTSPAMPSADNMLQQVLTNYRTYFGHIVTDFKAEWLVLIGIIGVAFVVASILKSQRNKVLAALLYDLGKTDDLRPCAHNDKQFQFAVVLKGYIGIVRTNIHNFTPSQKMYRVSRDQSIRLPT